MAYQFRNVFLKRFQYKIFLKSKYAAPIYFIFICRLEPNMKSFSHANNIILRRVIYIHSLPGVKLSNFSLLQTKPDVQ